MNQPCAVCDYYQCEHLDNKPRIILVDDAPKTLTPETIESFKVVRSLMDLSIVKHQSLPDPDTLDVRTWELNYLETDCGYACTPDGCRGHDTDIPDQLIIGNTVLNFQTDDLDHVGYSQAAAVGRFLNRMISLAKQQYAESAAIATDISFGQVDPGTKTIVRGRDDMLKKVEAGYRLFGDIQNPGIKFLRASGKPDLLYYEV